jgi:hypothetical protein
MEMDDLSDHFTIEKITGHFSKLFKLLLKIEGAIRASNHFFGIDLWTPGNSIFLKRNIRSLVLGNNSLLDFSHHLRNSIKFILNIAMSSHSRRNFPVQKISKRRKCRRENIDVWIVYSSSDLDVFRGLIFNRRFVNSVERRISKDNSGVTWIDHG